MMCLLTRANMPPIRFLFVGTELCSPASFSPGLTVSNLAAYQWFEKPVLSGVEGLPPPIRDLHPLD